VTGQRLSWENSISLGYKVSMAVQWECARLAAALWTYSTLHPILLCQGRAFLAPQWPVCTHSFSLSFCRTHTHTHFFFSLSLYTATSDQPFPSFPTRHIHFLIPSLRPSHPSLFHPSLYCNELCVSPLQLLPSLSSAALSFGVYLHGCRRCEQGQQSPPVSIPAPAEICNARQHSAMSG